MNLEVSYNPKASLFSHSVILRSPTTQSTRLFGRHNLNTIPRTAAHSIRHFQPIPLSSQSRPTCPQSRFRRTASRFALSLSLRQRACPRWPANITIDGPGPTSGFSDEFMTTKNRAAFRIIGSPPCPDGEEEEATSTRCCSC